MVLLTIIPSDPHEKCVLLVPAIFGSMDSEVLFLVQKYLDQEKSKSLVKLYATHVITYFLLLVLEILRQGKESIS